MKKGVFERKDFLSRFKRWLLLVNLARVMLLIGIVSISSTSYSQTINGGIEVSGRVTDNNNEPIPGVSIVVKGTTRGTITDFEGNYNLSVPSGSEILEFSSIGFESQEFSVENQAVINVTLEESTIGLDEVVVVGYGTQTKESVVGAISQVGSEGLVRSGSSNVTNALAGKLSGVLTMQSTGEPGANDSEVIIRGLSSWSGSQPLVLVDGVERDYKSIDPNEIKTLSVLKDASATAVFGAKGANGVILVTTKRGRMGKPKLEASASYGVQVSTQLPDHITSHTTMSMYNHALMNKGSFSQLISQNELNEYRNPSSRINQLRYPDVNWFDLLTKPMAPTVNANFNISGGTEKVKYFASLGYLDEGSFFKAAKEGRYDLNYNYKRFNYRANVDFDLTKSTVLSFNMGGETGKKNQPTKEPWRDFYTTTGALYPAFWPDWALDYIPDPDYPNDEGRRFSTAYDSFTENPYTKLNSGQFKENTDSKLFTDLILDQKLDFITEGLSVKGKVALSTYYNNTTLEGSLSYPSYRMDFHNIGEVDPVTGKVIAPKLNSTTDEILNPWVSSNESNEVFSPPILSLDVGGLENNFYQDLYYEFAFNYNRKFGNHNVGGLALFNRHQKNKGTDFAYLYEGLVGRVEYNYSLKYLVEFNVGYTGSERFAPEKRYGFFPSAAIGWVVSEEPFFKDAVSWISRLKLRYSDGLVGSDNAPSRWLYISDYYKDARGYIHEDLGANSVAQWEEARKRDLGLEIGFLEEQFTLSVDLFDEHRDNMLLAPNTVTMFVGNNFKALNLGEMKKHGIEVEIGHNKKINSNFRYHLSGMFGFNENRVLFKDDLPYSPEHQKAAGKPLGNEVTNGVLLTGSGYLTSVDDIHNYPVPSNIENLNVGDYKFLDYNVDGQITTLDKYPIKGLSYPPITYSFAGGFTYKNFDFSFLFQGNEGKYVEYNQVFESEFSKESKTVHKSQLDYWTPANSDANHATLHFVQDHNLTWGGGNDNDGYDALIQDRFWRNADYLRLKEIYLGYTLGKGIMNRLNGVSDVHFYFTGNNLLTFTDLIEGDPERKDFQRGYYPLMSTFKFGVKVSF